MIAIVQNTQTLQFDQMQVALQTAQNHVSIETPLKVEQLMTTHFNLAILTDNEASNRLVDASTGETGAPAPEPTNPVSDEETICKAIHWNSHANKCDKSTQPTSAVIRHIELNRDKLKESRRVMSLITLGIFLIRLRLTLHHYPE